NLVIWLNILKNKGKINMPIKYDKLLKLFADNGYTSYKIKKEKLIGQGTLTAIKNGTGGLDAKSIAKLCAVFHCQPGDLMEYVEDTETE
ncbi:MAG: helix-turn-helix transcriptional regulator, partial [Bacteroidales bacterium]|nr:helix-turn-helix transcriptional regulator [Bacteroidales bacterium]